MMGFIDTMKAGRHANRSACRVLLAQGHQVVARVYRAQTGGVQLAPTVIDDLIFVAISSALGLSVVETADGKRRRLIPEGPCCRRRLR